MKQFILITTHHLVDSSDLENYVINKYYSNYNISFWPELSLHVDNQSRPVHPNKIKNTVDKIISTMSCDKPQIIITYSEHILNALRVAVHQDKLQPDQLKILYLENRPGCEFDFDIDSTELKIDKDGRLDNWPRGFFDQIEEDLLILLSEKNK